MKVCGLDVHKDSIFCAIYDGKKYSEVKEFSTMVPSICSMGSYLLSEKVEKVAMESTSIYWMPVWNVLSDMGLELMLVNPFLIKQMPGRKSDVKDAQWIATLLYKDMLRGSLIPDERQRQLRDYSRKYTKLQQKKTRLLQEMDRILVMGGYRISSCVSHTDGKSFLSVVDALIGGVTDPEALQKLVYASRENKKSGRLKAALSGRLTESQQDILAFAKQDFDLTCSQIEACLKRMESICEDSYARQFELLKTIPGVGKIAAMTILAEIGADVEAFADSGRLTGWAGLRPRNDESAGKYKSTAVTKGNTYIRSILVQSAWAASRIKGGFFQNKFSRLVVRKSSKKAIVAIARKILVIIWHVLKDGKTYNPELVHIPNPNKLSAQRDYHLKQLEKINRQLDACQA